jgi:formamidopyrimidine-DNA glycosylase
MPEQPDLSVYREALEARVVGATLRKVRLANPFLLRTAVPPITEAEGKRVLGVQRIAKQLVLALEGGLYLVMHLMIAGRLHWTPAGAGKPRSRALAVLDFDTGQLSLTEAGTKRRASLHLVRGEAALAAFDKGGIDVLEATPAEFAQRLRRENHTLKRALTDPRMFSGIGNAYSDEILHRARLSPVMLTNKLSDEEIERLRDATQAILIEWTQRLREQAAGEFPEKVTAFRAEMAVHGRFGKPCPVCGSPVQRIVYAENEANYCARCQTGGTVLADRALSRLLHKSWPRSLDDA